MARPIVLLLVLASLPLAPVARAAPGVTLRDPAAEAEFRRALDAWEHGDYAAAAEALDTTYALEPHPDLLYARAQARRMLGRCRDALALFEAYLATNPDAPDKVRDTHINIERCRAQLDGAAAPAAPAAPTAEAEPRPGPPRVSEPVDPTPPSPPPRPWFRDPLGGALVGTGLAGLAVGGVLWVSTLRADDRSVRAGTYGEFHRAHRVAERRNVAAAVVTATSSALLVGGIVRWIVAARRSRRATTNPSPPRGARAEP